MKVRWPAATLVGVALAAAALAVPRPGAAQQAAYPTVPWGASPQAVEAALRQLGFKLDSMELSGIAFQQFSAGSTRIGTTFGPSGLAMLNQIHPLPPPLARRRFEELRDSLVRVLGEPDSVRVGPKWMRPDGQVLLWVRPDSGSITSAAILSRARPDFAAELRAAYRESVRQVEADPRRWTEARFDTVRWKPLVVADSQAVALDKTRVERRPGDTWRIWVRRDYRAPVTASGRSYDLVIQQLEIGCAEGTYRPGEGITLLDERGPKLLAGRWGVRSRPREGSMEQAVVASFCAHARDLP